MKLPRILMMLVTLFFAACWGDPGCYENTYVVNQTKDTLYIQKYYNEADLKSDQSFHPKIIIVKPDSTTLLWEHLHLGVPEMFTLGMHRPEKDSILIKYKGKQHLLSMLDTNLYLRKESKQTYGEGGFKEVAFYRVIKDVDFEGKNAITIDTLSSSFIADSSLNDGGGCWYSATEDDEKKGIRILVTQMNKRIRKALLCINKQMLVLKFDSVHSIGDTNKETETFEYYSGSKYRLVIDNFLKWKNGQAEQELKSTMEIITRNGEAAKKHIIGPCGTN